MHLISLILFTGLAVGIYLLLDLSPEKITNDILSIIGKKPKLTRQVKLAKKGADQNKIKLAIMDTRNALEMSGKGAQFTVLCTTSIVLFFVGLVFSLIIGNLLILPIISIVLALVPFLYVRSVIAGHNRLARDELETALSIITTAYIRTDSIITAVEENINHLKPPIQDIFKGFLGDVAINPDTSHALRRLKGKLNNSVFAEWIDGLIDCQTDRNLKYTLLPIANKLSDIRIINAELDILLYEPRREFLTLLMLVIGNIPLLRLLNRDWFNTLMFSVPGKIVLAIVAVVSVVSTILMFKFTQPIEYKR